jgi:hypothetical protein
MNKIIILVLLYLSCACVQGQVSKLNVIMANDFTNLNRELLVDTTKVVYDVVEIQPSPAGGMAGWNKYLSENLRYPPDAQRKGIEGTVIVAFVVNTDGTTTDIEILRSVGGGCD